MNMKKLATLFMIAIMVFALAACGGGGGSSEGGSEAEGDSSTLVIAMEEEIDGCDVQQIEWNNAVHELINEPLVTISSDLSEVTPGLAESYEITDEYIDFVIPEGLTFSSGNPLDAEAVKASTERYLEISPYASDLESVTSVEVVNGNTVRYNLSGPAPYMWTSIASTFGGVQDVKYAEEVGDEEYNRKPSTFGPFYVEEWEQGSQIVLKRNENFKTNNPGVDNKGMANFDTVIVRFIPDEFTRVSELESGDVDLAYKIPTSSLADLEANEAVDVYTYMQPGITYLRLNTLDGPTADAKVREALMIAVNRDELVENNDGVVVPVYGFISAAETGYSADEEAKLAEKFKYDPDRAKALLEEAGWTDTDGDGFVDKDGENLSFEMLIASDRATNKNSGSVLQKQFADVGVDAQIREYEATYIKQLMKEDDYTMASHTFEWADADILIYVFTDASGLNYNVPEITDAIVKAREENDAAKRVKAYEEVSELLAAEIPGVPLFYDKYIVAAKNNVQGVKLTNDGRNWFSDLHKE